MTNGKHIKYCRVVRQLVEAYHGPGRFDREDQEKESASARRTYRRLVAAYKEAESLGDEETFAHLKASLFLTALKGMDPAVLLSPDVGDRRKLAAELYIHLRAIHRPVESPKWHIVYEIARILAQEKLLDPEEVNWDYPPAFFPVGETALGKQLQRFFKNKNQSKLIKKHQRDPANHCVHHNPNRKPHPDLPPIRGSRPR